MVNGGLQIAGYFCGLLSGKCRVKFFGVVNETKLIHSRQSDANPLVVCRLTPPNYSPFLTPPVSTVS